MGANCTSACTGNHNRNKGLGQFSNVPDDINNYTPEVRPNLPNLKFDGILSNIKIYNYPKDSISLKFIIEDQLEVLLPRKVKSKDNNEIKWKSKEDFTLFINQYQLRKMFLYIEGTDQKGKILTHMKVNLFRIATGPYHHDFSFNLGSSECRLQFDLKIFQYVQTKVKFQRAELNLNNKFFEADTLYFNIRILREQSQDPFVSTPSYNQTLSLDHQTQNSSLKQNNFRVPDIDMTQCQSPIRFRRGNKLFDSSRIVWSEKKGEMPEFKVFLKVNDIKTALVHFVIWKVIQDEVTHFADAHIPIYKLYGQDTAQDSLTIKSVGGHVQSRIFRVQNQKISNNEQQIGSFSLTMSIQNSKYYRQMKACARTEQGVVSMAPVANRYGVDVQTRKDKFTKIGSYIQKIQRKNMQLNSLGGVQSQDFYENRRTMLVQFQGLRTTLQNSLEQSFIMPINQNQQKIKLAEDQQFLLSVMKKIQIFLQDDQNFTQICWDIMLAIIKRGQFYLNNIGFSKKQSDQMGNGQCAPCYLRKKIRVALEYQQIVHRLFLLSLKLGYIEGRQRPKPVIQIFKAYCYFRIPAFRDILLNMVARKQDQTVEWKTDTFDSSLEMAKQCQNIFVGQLDWQLCFYKPLQSQTKSQSLNKELIDNLEGNIWLTQVSKRGSTFFYFLHFLVERLMDLGKKIKFIKWQYFPGYNRLVRSFLCQMRKIRVISYPKSLLQTSINLLVNQKLINILMSTVFEKTNVYDCNQLMKSLQIINRYLKFLTRQKKLLPPTFNYVYLFKSLKQILQGDFSYGIIKTLGVIFNNYESFNVEFRKTLSLYLLGKVFFKLFLNWSYSVRSFFYHIMVLKISRSSDIFNPESRKQFSNRHQIMTQISTRYEHVMKLLRNAEAVKKQEDSTDFFKKEQAQLHKQLKRKLNKKKRQDSIYKKPQRKIQTPNKIDLFNSTAFEKPATQKKSQKYSVAQLSKVTTLQRSQSAHIDAEVLSFVKNNIKKNRSKDTSTRDQQSNLDQIVINRINSSTTPKDESQSDQQAWKDVNKYQLSKKKSRKMSFFSVDDFQVMDIQKKQVEYLSVALKQYEQLDQAIRKYMVENGQLPVCDLDKFQIPYDEDIRPSTMAIDEWEHMTNILS